MHTTDWHAPYKALLQTLSLSASQGLPGVVITGGEDPLMASPHRLARAAAVAAAAQAAAISCAWFLRTGSTQMVRIDSQDALNTLNTSAFLRQQGYNIGFGSGHREPLNNFYLTRDDQWFRFVGSRQHHRDAILHLLGCGNYRGSIEAAIGQRNAHELEEDSRILGVPGVAARTASQWRSEKQGRRLNALPVVQILQIGESAAEPLAVAPQALTGLRVLDMTHVLAGPAAARSMAAHGAHVLRLSSPAGSQDPDYMAMDTGFGKRNAFVDLDAPSSSKLMDDLVQGADVFAQSFRPGSLAKRGLSPERLAALRPGLIYLSVSCYGDGPWEERAGFDPNALAATGVCIDEGAGGAPRMPPTLLLSDYLTGSLAAAGVAAALCKRAELGGSYHVKVSLARTAMWVQDLGLMEPNAYEGAASKLGDSPIATRTASAFGELTHLPPFPDFSDSPVRWRNPPLPLGEAPASWDIQF